MNKKLFKFYDGIIRWTVNHRQSIRLTKNVKNIVEWYITTNWAPFVGRWYTDGGGECYRLYKYGEYIAKIELW